jgi:hypothetical protein
LGHIIREIVRILIGCSDIAGAKQIIAPDVLLPQKNRKIIPQGDRSRVACVIMEVGYVKPPESTPFFWHDPSPSFLSRFFLIAAIPI